MSGKKDENLLERISELESELRAKDAELAQMRLRLNATNTRLEQVIDSISFEIKMASKIQKLLSPVEIPNISGFDFSTKFVPGTKSGGDYFDIFEHEDRLRFGIVLSSGSGYGISALFLSILMKISSRVEARRGLQPHEMVKAVAAEMLPEMKDNDKASLFYGIVDRRNFEMSYCLVGDIMGFAQIHGQEALQRLKVQSPALSKGYNTEPQSAKISLNSKDRLILCTEGFVKETGQDGKPWGEGALTEAIRQSPRQGVHEMRNEILYRCEAFSGKTEPDRDQTVLVLEVKDKVIKLARQ